MRILLGGIVGGLLLFGWGYVVHAHLPFGRMGLSAMPDEATWQATVSSSAAQPGLYLFPYAKEKPTREEHAAWAGKWKAGPSGLLVLAPPGRDPLDKKVLGIELGSNVLVALLASWVLTIVSAGYGGRVAVVTMFGIASWAAVVVPLWNWFGFPTDYLLGQLAVKGGGALIAGLAIGGIVRPAELDLDLDVGI
jgi:hypothetical protein